MATEAGLIELRTLFGRLETLVHRLEEELGLQDEDDEGSDDDDAAESAAPTESPDDPGGTGGDATTEPGDAGSE
jgi:hypothetical protein